MVRDRDHDECRRILVARIAWPEPESVKRLLFCNAVLPEFTTLVA
jgi:hypothetical protein